MNVRDNLAAGKYENKVPYDIDKIPVDENTMTVKQAREHEESEKQRKKDQRGKWHAGEAAMTELVRLDLESEHGIAGHPKSGALWSLAWDRGHSGGYSEVIIAYEEMVELIK